MLEQSKWSKQELSNSAFRRFAKRMLLTLETLQFTLRFFKFENLFLEPRNMGIGTGQLGATRV
jgi:hypothetical protein